MRSSSHLHHPAGGASAVSAALRIGKMQAQRPLATTTTIHHQIALVLMMILLIQTVRCLQSDSSADQRQQQQQEQQQRAALVGGQVAGGGGSGYGGAPSSLLAAADSMLMSGYLNNKRARKMSAFMPMRGRKDGRDEPASSYYGGASEWLPPMHESQDADQDNSILRLLANQQQAALIGGTPRSFVDQIAARRAAAQMVQHQPVQQQQQQQQSLPQPTRGGGEVVFEPNSLSLVADPSALEMSAGGSQSAVMQAKLRRAFHPMRGKKRFDPELQFNSDLGDQDQLAAEYAEM